MLGGQSIQCFQPVEEGDLKAAFGLADFGDIVEIHLLQLGGFAFGGEHQPDSIGNRAKGQLTVALFGGKKFPFSLHRLPDQCQVAVERRTFQKLQGFLLLFWGGPAPGGSPRGIPGEGKTILLAGHNNTFFNDLQHTEIGATVTITTHYGVYTYEVTDMAVKDYQDETAYDFTRTDENLILYTCYPFDALGFTPNRYFVYAKYVSGPVLDKNS